METREINVTIHRSKEVKEARKRAEKRRMRERLFTTTCVLIICAASALLLKVALFDDTAPAEADFQVTQEVIDQMVDRRLEAATATAPIPEDDDEVIEMSRVLCTVTGYDGDVDYSALIQRVYAIARQQDDPMNEGLMYILCELLEDQRNLKLIDMGLEDQCTDVFNTFAEWDDIYAVMDPPEPEPEPEPVHTPYVNYTEQALRKGAAVLYGEAGANWCTDQHRRDVAAVIVNRIMDSRFPNDLESVVYASNQYPNTCKLTYYDQRCYDIMKDALEYGPWDGDITTVWQSGESQGREIVRVYRYQKYNSVTYICR